MSPRKSSHFGFLLAGLASLVLSLFLIPYPLVGTPGPEAASVLALLIAPLLLLIGAHKGASRDARGFSNDLFSTCLCMLLVFLPFLLVLWSNSFRFETCTENRGFLVFGLLAFPPLALNHIFGLWIGRLTGKRRLACVMALASYFIYASGLVVWWWSHPTFHLVTHFSALVGSDMLNGFQLKPAMIAYRASTFIFVVSLAAFGLLTFKNKERQGLVSTLPVNRIGLVSTLALFVLGLGISLVSANAIAPSRFELQRTYTFNFDRDGIVVHANPDWTSVSEVEKVHSEAHYWRDKLQKRIGTASSKDIHVWLHPSEEEKHKFTGAKHVHFALPKHRTVHISGSTVPHSTLGHELAHVLIGEVSSTLWGLPGSWGIIPNWGLTEGLATLLTEELSMVDNLTLKEQAFALLQNETIDLKKIFSPWPFEAWQTSPRKAYVIAAAFLSDLIHSSSDYQATFKKLASNQTNSLLTSKNYKQFQLAAQEASLPTYASHTLSEHFNAGSILMNACNKRLNAVTANLHQKAMQGAFLEAEQLANSQEKPALLFYQIAQDARTLKNSTTTLYYLEEAAKSYGSKQDFLYHTLQDESAELLWLLHHPKKAIARWQKLQSKNLPPHRQREIEAKLTFAKITTVSAHPLHAVASKALQLLFRQQTEVERSAMYSELSYELGKTKNLHLAQDLQKPWQLAHYLMARYFVNIQLPQKAERHLKLIQTQPNALPPIFEEESKILTANVLIDKKMFSEALKTISAQLDRVNAQTPKRLYQDRIARLEAMQRDSQIVLF